MRSRVGAYAWYRRRTQAASPPSASARTIDENLFESSTAGEGIMYVGDKGIVLGGFNGNHPRVYPESPSIKRLPRGKSMNAIWRWTSGLRPARRSQPVGRILRARLP